MVRATTAEVINGKTVTHTHTPREREQYPSRQLVWPCHCICVCVLREKELLSARWETQSRPDFRTVHTTPHPPHRPRNNTTLASSGFFFPGGNATHHYSTVIVGPWNVLKPETKCVWRRVSSVGTVLIMLLCHVLLRLSCRWPVFDLVNFPPLCGSSGCRYGACGTWCHNNHQQQQQQPADHQFHIVLFSAIGGGDPRQCNATDSTVSAILGPIR